MANTLLALHLGAMVGFGLAALLIAHFVSQRRPPVGNVSWALFIVLFPYLGLPLYLLLGGRKMRRLASRKRAIALAPVAEQVPPEHGAHHAEVETLLMSHRIPPPSTGNRVVLHTTGQDHYTTLLRLIAEAQHSIYVCMYLFRLDAVGREVLEALVRRARDGVKVRLLLDGVGSLHTTRRSFASLTNAGGRVSYFMPVFRRPLRGRANLRNHRKSVIVDERIVMGGGANIGMEYMGPAPDPAQWRDLTTTLEGPAVRHWYELFRSDWAFASGEWLRIQDPEPRQHLPGSARIQIVPSGPDVPGDPLADALLTLAQHARERVWIVTPYFIPDDAFCRTLTLCAHRKVDVRIIAPARTNHLLAEFAGRSYLREIERAGGKVFGHPQMLHAKAVVIDHELAILGSANVDMRSLLLNYETALFISSAADVRMVTRWIESVQKECKLRHLSDGGFAELGEGLARLIAPQL